jgi:hypothetical protein
MMAVRLDDLLASLPLHEQAAIQARFDELSVELHHERARRERVERDREMAHACEIGDDETYDRLMREDRKAAHAEARATIERKRTPDASLPSVGPFHG